MRTLARSVLATLLAVAIVIGCAACQPQIPDAKFTFAHTAKTPSGIAGPLTAVSIANIAPVIARDTKADAGTQVTAADPYFTKPGVEKIVTKAKAGYWQYRSPNVYVEIKRITDKKKVQTYFVADVRLKPAAMERAGFANPKKPGRGTAKLYKIARSYGAVLAINGDYMHEGIIIRDGKKYYERKGRDTLAFYPDGTLKIIKSGKKTAKQLIKEGVKNTFAFGPTLINDSKINPKLKKDRLYATNPRTAVGMVEPYHYILVVVDGRQAGYSRGMTLQELANLFKKYKCTVAYNLDGGQSSAMSFMGNNISQYKRSYTRQRSLTDALMFGQSKKVPKK